MFACIRRLVGRLFRWGDGRSAPAPPVPRDHFDARGRYLGRELSADDWDTAPAHEQRADFWNARRRARGWRLPDGWRNGAP